MMGMAPPKSPNCVNVHVGTTNDQYVVYTSVRWERRIMKQSKVDVTRMNSR